jgi:hypothetical protein
MTITRPEVTARSGLPELTALDLQRHVSVPEAAEYLKCLRRHVPQALFTLDQKGITTA